MKSLTRAWVRKAEADFRMARSLARSADRSNDGICFPCQQSAEKYLKALMQELDLTIPRTHALEDLGNSLVLFHPILRSFNRGLGFLTGFAVETRYPGKTATRRQSKAALRWADRVRTAARTLLGLPLRSKRQK
jgi:HEPN domain-containing protein